MDKDNAAASSASPSGGGAGGGPGGNNAARQNLWKNKGKDAEVSKLNSYSSCISSLSWLSLCSISCSMHFLDDFISPFLIIMVIEYAILR